MYVALLVAILLPIIAIQADDPKPCCCSNQITADVYVDSKKWFTMYVDYTMKRIVEDNNGFHSRDFSLYNLETKEKYLRLLNGLCTIYPFDTLWEYAQCLPNDAIFIMSQVLGDGKTVNVFSYKVGDKNILKAVYSDTCLPHQITMSFMGFTSVIEWKNVKDHIKDSSVFDKDIDDCIKDPGQ